MNRLKEIREKRNISQRELARRTNITSAQISRYESGQKLTEESIRQIVIALDTSADYLLGLIDDEEKK
ncbi:MAG: helix-turn-helix transcriptional regulator [Firmicutes bacterium]|nr:helix-turn-helix transcriptional regulator [Bacillota bacterium]